MGALNIVYKTSTANSGNITDHLIQCSDHYIPPLIENVDIATYAVKIVELAVTFEAWDCDVLVGLVAAYYNDPVSRTGFVTNVSTIKKYRGIGIASVLLNKCILYGGQHGFTEISLQVNDNNSSAIHLYAKFGFKKLPAMAGEFLMKKSLN